jgi:methyltransferase (TIGR00027 family)
MTSPYLKHISDTARWVAVHRARESARPDALFHDPLALKLAGIEGEAIHYAMRRRGRMPDWPIVMRTIALDADVLRAVADGVDMVIDLAAGLDARPYRLPLPSSLTWVDVDLPDITEYKNKILAEEKPNCKVERIVADLSDPTVRRALFAQLGARAKKALIITEGLLVYLTEEQVSGLATDLAAIPTFTYWTLEMCSAALLPRLQRTVGKRLAAAGMPFRWGSAEGPDYFRRFGWKAIEVRSMFREAGKHKRLNFPMNLFWYLPTPNPEWKQPWAGVCLFERSPSP